MPTLHIHLDESGDWAFNKKGTRFFVLATAWTYDPQPLADDLTRLRFGLVRKGWNIDAFHASPDKQPIRDVVTKTMLAQKNWHWAAVVIEKCKVNPTLREPHRFYPKFAGSLLRFIFRGSLRSPTERVLVYADSMPIGNRAKREGVIKAIKTTCASDLDASVEHHIFSHRLPSNAWIQVADYCCWSVFKKWESDDARAYTELTPRLRATEMNITARGDQTKYY
jgi:hypothetical protein